MSRKHTSGAALAAGVIGTIFGLALLVPGGSGSAARASDEPAGKQVFLDNKCNLCHSIETAGIEAKVKNEKMRGPDLGGVVKEKGADWTMKWLRREEKIDGKVHKKEWSGTDEDLGLVVAWLEQQKKPGS